MNTWSRIFLLIAIAAVIWAVISYKVRRDSIKEVEEHREYVRHIQEETSEGYLYVDLNGVYHYSHECIHLRKGDSKGSYSYKHFKKPTFFDWNKFFETEQICARCFKTPYINQLKKESKTIEKHNDLYHIEVDELFNELDDE